MKNKSICAVCSGQQADQKWLPLSIKDYRENVLSRYAGETVDYQHPLHPVFSNIAYNMQYLEYLNKCFEDLYLTSVLRAQNVKMFLLTTTQVVECFLYVKLIEMGVNKNDIWDLAHSLRIAGEKNAFALGSQFYRNELKWLKELRNRIHLQSPEGISEADYAVFESLEVLNRTKALLYAFLQKALHMPGSDMQMTFYFLSPTADFVHSVTKHEHASE